MASEKEKELQQLNQQQATQQPQAPALYGGSYDGQISDAYTQLTGRKPFQYDLDGDALYQQYKDRYTENARQSMKDTVGQGAALTGGYGNSYGQIAGQQRYDEALRGLTDMIPQLEQNAFNRYQAEGDRLQDQFGLLNQMGAQEQATKKDNYTRIYNSIFQTGNIPDEDELNAAGMSADEANAIRQAWIVQNPMLAYQNGAIDPEGYRSITGSYPPGYTAPGAGGYYIPKDDETEGTPSRQYTYGEIMAASGRGGDQVADAAVAAGQITEAQARAIKDYWSRQ